MQKNSKRAKGFPTAHLTHLIVSFRIKLNINNDL